jgi:hypothetical protein
MPTSIAEPAQGLRTRHHRSQVTDYSLMHADVGRITSGERSRAEIAKHGIASQGRRVSVKRPPQMFASTSNSWGGALIQIKERRIREHAHCNAIGSMGPVSLPPASSCERCRPAARLSAAVRRHAVSTSCLLLVLLLLSQLCDLAPFLSHFHQYGLCVGKLYGLCAQARSRPCTVCVSTGAVKVSTVSTLFLIGWGWRPLARLPPATLSRRGRTRESVRPPPRSDDASMSGFTPQGMFQGGRSRRRNDNRRQTRRCHGGC